MNPDMIALMAGRIHWDHTWPPNPFRQVDEFREWGAAGGEAFLGVI